MTRKSILVGLAVLLILSSCSQPPAGTVERRFELPDGLGTFLIRLDSNFTRIDSGIDYGCTKCESRLSQSYVIQGWPDSIYPPLTGLDVSKDSLFRFTWNVNLHSPAECDSGLAVQEWLRSQLQSLRQECPACAPIDSGIFKLNGTQWAFIQYSDDWATQNSTVQNDMLDCYTCMHGRGMNVHWQRLSPSQASFDFGAYARRQLGTAEFQ